VKAAKGDLDGAIADCAKAIALKPDLAEAYINRGFIRYDSHDFTDALFDFRKAVELGSSNNYARFWLWLIRARLGETEAATTELQTYLAGRAGVKQVSVLDIYTVYSTTAQVRLEHFNKRCSRISR
jgi:tetratricopeptide (TPR) repeat protein